MSTRRIRFPIITIREFLPTIIHLLKLAVKHLERAFRLGQAVHKIAVENPLMQQLVATHS
jgi:hypothetical protein